MSRATAWLFVVVLATGTFCHAQEIPAPKRLPDDKTPPTKDDKTLPTKEDKTPPTKTDQIPPPKEDKAPSTNDKSAKPSAPILFPSPPFPPPAPPVLDPRTRAWEQIHSDVPPENAEPVVVAEPSRTRMTLGEGLRQLRARCKGEHTIGLSRNEQTGEWHICEVSPGK